MALWLPSLIIQDSLSAAALGQIPGRRTDIVSGHNPDIDAGPEDIWEGGGTWVAPTAPRNHAIASTNANDTAGGTGMRTAVIIGLTSWTATDPVTEIVTMNGTTPVNTVNNYVFISDFFGSTFGSGEVNAGTVNAVAAVDGTTTARMGITDGAARQAIAAVPAGNYGLIHNAFASMSRFSATAGAQAKLVFKVKMNADAADSGWIVGGNVALSLEGSSVFGNSYKVPLVLPPKSLIKISALSVSDNDTDISASFEIEYVKV